MDPHVPQRSQLVGGGQIAVSEPPPTAPPADLAEQWGPPDARPTPSPDGTLRLERLITVDTMSVPKSSHAVEENEDAWAADASNGRVALADGASSAFMAREWARILVDDFVRGHELLHGSRRAWLQDATARWASHAGAGDDQWWARDSGARGSAATFLGLSLSHVGDAGAMEFRVAAIGDTCVVQLAQHQGRLQPIAAFPLERAEDFGRHPDLLSTVQESRPMPNVRALTGEVGTGDVFLMMTDAVAEWATAGARHDPTVWEHLMALGSHEFERLVETERAAGRLHDDDTTLIRVVPCASAQRDQQHQLR